MASKYRRLELRAGAPHARGRRGPAASYWANAETRQQDQAAGVIAETEYRRFTAKWKPRLKPLDEQVPARPKKNEVRIGVPELGATRRA
jgi:hypothetical protein